MKAPVPNSSGGRQRVLIYKILNTQIDFTFEVWAYAPMPDQALQHAYGAFLARQDTFQKRQSLAGCTIRQMTNHGLPSSAGHPS